MSANEQLRNVPSMSREENARRPTTVLVREVCAREIVYKASVSTENVLPLRARLLQQQRGLFDAAVFSDDVLSLFIRPVFDKRDNYELDGDTIKFSRKKNNSPLIQDVSVNKEYVQLSIIHVYTIM